MGIAVVFAYGSYKNLDLKKEEAKIAKKKEPSKKQKNNDEEQLQKQPKNDVEMDTEQQQKKIDTNNEGQNEKGHQRQSTLIHTDNTLPSRSIFRRDSNC